jgi:LPS export ABC transporter permease LptF/LPS export ABC transporter permease LptG
MRLLTRYIFKEVFSHSLLGLLVFTFVIFIPHMSHLLELLVRRDLSLGEIFVLFLLPMPGIVVLTIPMAVLVGTLIGLSRMAADGEVIAVRASGIGMAQFVRPVMFFAVLGWAATSWMSLQLAPRATRKLHQMEAGLKSSQIPYDIQPRVFLEQFPNYLLYLQDVSGSHSRWRGVFIADTTQRDSPKITVAENGVLINDPRDSRLMLHLEQGTTHELDPQNPGRYSVISFTDTDIPIPIEQTGEGDAGRQTPAMMSLRTLLNVARYAPDATNRQSAQVELHYRFALPVASLVLALVGIPLGLFTRKGGKAVGVILTIFLVFLYYILMAFGLSLARQGRIHPALGLWLANAAFGVGGLLMLFQMRKVRMRLQFIQEWFLDLARRIDRHRQSRENGAPGVASAGPHPTGNRFFQILDAYVIRGWLFYFAALLVTFTGIYMIFDFFQLLGDIVRNHVAALVVMKYYWYLCPQVVYLMFPLSILVATLVNFGLLTKTNQITAIKATGISLYRIALPIMLAALIGSVGMFVLEDLYLPQMNQRQDALRNQIKGKPAQTYYRPDRQWIFGQGERIYNYRFFDADRDVFANLSIFELDPQTFKLAKRIYANRAFWEPHLHRWVMEQGWVREISGGRVTYQPFAVSTFDELSEEPPYFKKEVKPSAQMNAFELRRYIGELSQSGFDVVRLSVQFYHKFSFPLMAFVVVLIGIPFSFSMGSKGALSGIALSIGIAIVYLSTAGMFEAMGNLSQLPPLIAAWSPDILFGLGGMYLLLRVRT